MLGTGGKTDEEKQAEKDGRQKLASVGVTMDSPNAEPYGSAHRPQFGDLPAVATGWCFSTTEIRSFLTAQ